MTSRRGRCSDCSIQATSRLRLLGRRGGIHEQRVLGAHHHQAVGGHAADSRRTPGSRREARRDRRAVGRGDRRRARAAALRSAGPAAVAFVPEDVLAQAVSKAVIARASAARGRARRAARGRGERSPLVWESSFASPCGGARRAPESTGASQVWQWRVPSNGGDGGHQDPRPRRSGRPDRPTPGAPRRASEGTPEASAQTGAHRWRRNVPVG